MIALATTQSAELERIASRLAELIISFCTDRLAVAPEFNMVELTAWVSRHVVAAPDSAGRILRDLRKRGLVRYKVTNRRASTYRVEGVAA